MNMWVKALVIAVVLGCLLVESHGRNRRGGDRGDRGHHGHSEGHDRHWRVCNKTSRFEECCWSGTTHTLYDRRNSLCCKSTTGPGGEVRPRPESTCSAACCGSTTYNRDTELCCENTVKDKLANACNQGCCGDSVYDRDGSQICCNRNTLVDIPSNIIYPRCCGVTVYDGKTHSCCNGELINKATHCCTRRGVQEGPCPHRG